jgi:drug/metabolite transporter (DMT)-like permease
LRGIAKQRRMTPHSNLRAAFWMACALGCLLLMTWSGRETTSQLDVFQVMEMRSLLGLVLLYPLVLRAGGFRAMRTGRIGMHVVRNIGHYGGQFTWLAALTMIPLAQLVAIEFTAPIWTALLAVAFLGERMNFWRTAAVCLGLLGVIVIVRPGVESFSIGQMLVLFAALSFAVSFVTTKSLTRTESVVAIIFWMLVIQSIIGFIPMFLVWKNPPVEVLPWIVLIAFGGSYAHFCIAKALANADATVVVPMDFLRVPATALLGWLAYSETIDWMTIAGTVLILGGNLLNLAGRPGSAVVPDP